MSHVDGGELLARALQAAGVSDVFALHGGHLEAFYRACVTRGVNLHDFRHEASAGHAAEAYARATGKLGVCVITAGPGFTNALTAIVNAQLDMSPVLFIVGSPPLREAQTNELQGGFDQISMAAPGCKWAHRVTNAERIPDLVATAARTALTGRRGAVVIDVPIDVLHIPVAETSVPAPTGVSVLPRSAPAMAERDRFVALLRAARRPAIVVGADARWADCQNALVSFAERAQAPVFAGKRGMGLMPAGHPLEGHDPNNLAQLQARGAPTPDLVVLLGTRMGLFLGGRGTGVMPADAKVVQVFSDAAEIGRLRRVDLGIVADAGSFLDAVLTQDRLYDEDRMDWARSAARLQDSHALNYPETENERGVHPFHAARVVAEVAGVDAIYAVDGGEAGQWTAQAVKIRSPGHLMTTGYLGGLGVAPGFAIGAQIADRDRRVVLATGDGSIGFHLQEFDTMVRHGLPIVTVIFNNEIWGMSLHGQQIMYGANYHSISKLGGTEYAQIATAFGCHGERVTRFDDLKPALERAFASGRPSVVEIMTDPEAVNPGLVRMLGKSDDDGGEITIPYYENIPR